ncbi:VOC family protein [Acinetobacter nematophilus]|uniref:Glyoxalase n=1 Tax=Acinetobacter nematophilus TaxID=2994642 RepID=A0A9X3DSB6_9GAMM|nr:VOC family protein [Acinetobacter nematophilus]MCX5467086.1 glyoxalase [Acinetobacter nematophilus]
MAIKRIVSNIQALDLRLAQTFYGDFLGMQLVMDQGWIKTYASHGMMSPQISIASQGGNATEVPDFSIEVDNVDELYVRAQQLNMEIIYPLTIEEWGVKRFYLKDPFGKTVNLLQHIEP